MGIEVSSSSCTEALGEDDRVLEVVALPGHEWRPIRVLAERHSRRGRDLKTRRRARRRPLPSARLLTFRLVVVISVPGLERMNFCSLVLVLSCVGGLDHEPDRLDVVDRCRSSSTAKYVAGCPSAARALHAGGRPAGCVWVFKTAERSWRCMFEPISALVGGRRARGTGIIAVDDRPYLLGRDIDRGLNVLGLRPSTY